MADDQYSVELVAKGRYGDMIYREGKNKAVFYWEIGGGGGVVFIIFIPKEEDWNQKYSWAQGRRLDIARRTAEFIANDNCGNCYAEYDEKHGDYLVKSRSG